MVFVHPMLSDEQWMSLFNTFTATIVDNFFDNLALFKNVKKCFIIVSWQIIGTDVIEIK